MPDSTILSYGSRGLRVRMLRRRLNAHGAKLSLSRADGGRFDTAVDEAVRAFQRRHGMQVDGVVGPITKKALNQKPGAVVKPVPPVKPAVAGARLRILSRFRSGLPSGSGATTVVSWPSSAYVVVHYPAMTSPLKSLRAAISAWRGFYNYHTGGHGWADIGYHFGICPDGTVLSGRPAQRRGAHSGNAKGIAGDPNSHPGICFLVANNQPLTPQQIVAYGQLVKHLGMNPANFREHNEFDWTSCPGVHIPGQLRKAFGR